MDAYDYDIYIVIQSCYTLKAFKRQFLGVAFPFSSRAKRCEAIVLQLLIH